VTSKSAVIDTNVGVAANAQADVSTACELTCIKRLRDITENGHLVLDADGQIFAEYRRHLRLAGEPGVGDAFMRWVHDHQYDEKFCTLVPLTIRPDGTIVEFPSASSLSNFDPSDKKFVAVVAAHPDRPPICVAVDRGWVRHRDALATVGVEIEFLCPNDIGT
jgi:hypothetical protein